jgi:hypothetical protein
MPILPSRFSSLRGFINFAAPASLPTSSFFPRETEETFFSAQTSELSSPSYQQLIRTTALPPFSARDNFKSDGG